jgi:hypothetical protein
MVAGSAALSTGFWGLVVGPAAAGALAVADDFRGVRIQSVAPADRAAGPPAGVKDRAPHSPRRWIEGIVQLDVADVDAIGLRPIQRALVLTARSTAVDGSWSLVGDRVLFPDDEEAVGGAIRGRFGFDLSLFFDSDEVFSCHVLVSAGPFLSNVIELRPSWA